MDQENVIYVYTYTHTHTHTHTHTGVIFSLKREGNPVICDNMDETDSIILSEKARQRKTNYKLLHSITYM